MSALAGYWGTGAPEACARMLSGQAIYGPHHGAQWDGGEMALGRRLWRLLPGDAYDKGPLTGAGGEVLAADLRLDNREELEAELGLTPDLAATLSDAGVLLAAWTRWEWRVFDRLTGDYAFALWRPALGELILARDPFGHRPLHFNRGAGFFAFASMPKGLHALPHIPRSPDEARLAQFLCLAPETGSASFFEGVERVEPGAWVRVTAEGISTERHFRLTRPGFGETKLDWPGGLRARLDQAVGAALRGAGDGVGAHLSSGWDSGAVAATAARLLAPNGGRVLAFTAVPPVEFEGAAPAGRLADEGPLAARIAADHANMDHIPVASAGRSPLEDVDRDGFLAERPMLNLCNQVWLNGINGEARARGVTVMLTGDLGNIAFSEEGLDRLGDLIAQRRWREWLHLARALTASRAVRRRGVLAASFAPWIPRFVWRGLDALRGLHSDEPMANSAIRRERLARGPSEMGAGLWARRTAAPRHIDLGPYYKGVLAGFGVDLRHPLADRRLVDYCLAAPTAEVLARGRPRSLARRALADRLPPAVLEARRRGYQSADWHEGLTGARGAVAAEVEALAAFAPAAALLDIPRLRRLIAAWPKGGWEGDAVTVRYRYVLLRAISAGRFLRRTLGDNG